MNRFSRILEIRERLKRKKPCIGTWIQIPSPTTIELLSSLNYFWIAIDQEHGNISYQSLPNLLRAIEINEKLALVRLAEANSQKL